MTQPPDPGDPFAPPPQQPAWGAQPPYAQWQPPPSPWGQPVRTNVCAILSLVFAFVCFPAAIVLGVVALVQLRSSQDNGKGLAVAGLVISGLWTALVALFIGLGVAGVFDDLGVSTGTVSQATSTTVGTCMRSSHDGRPNAVVPCEDAHDQEVYYVGRLGSGDYPGDDDVYDTADRICDRAFTSYVGTTYDDSDHDYDFYAPDYEEWVSREERRVVCVITPMFRTDHGSAYHSGD